LCPEPVLANYVIVFHQKAAPKTAFISAPSPGLSPTRMNPLMGWTAARCGRKEPAQSQPVGQVKSNG
jgi:hypothetical protein